MAAVSANVVPMHTVTATVDPATGTTTIACQTCGYTASGLYPTTAADVLRVHRVKDELAAATAERNAARDAYAVACNLNPHESRFPGHYYPEGAALRCAA